MKKTILSLLLLALLTLVRPLAAQISPTVSVQGTNATLRWASTPGESYVVLYRRAFHPAPELQWKVIGTNVPAWVGIETFFQHTGGVPRVPAGVGGGGGGGGSSPPVLLSATSPTTDSTQDKDDKVKAKDNALPAFPTLPDEKALEKWLKELLKEYERQQREGGGTPAFTALMASTLTAEQATSNSMGFYVVLNAADDLNGDGVPDGLAAQFGVNPLNDLTQTDTDGDGLMDQQEIVRGTDPSKRDTDGDGVEDATEVAYGSDPKTPHGLPGISAAFYEEAFDLPADGYYSLYRQDWGTRILESVRTVHPAPVNGELGATTDTVWPMLSGTVNTGTTTNYTDLVGGSRRIDSVTTNVSPIGRIRPADGFWRKGNIDGTRYQTALQVTTHGTNSALKRAYELQLTGYNITNGAWVVVTNFGGVSLGGKILTSNGTCVLFLPQNTRTNLTLTTPASMTNLAYQVTMSELSIDLQQIISDQIPGNSCNSLPTVWFENEDNNPMLMATRTGNNARIAVRVSFHSYFGANAFVGVRKLGTPTVLGSTRATNDPVLVKVQFQAEDGPQTYEVVAGYDANLNSMLDDSEVICVFQKTPAVRRDGKVATQYLSLIDKLIVVTQGDYARSQQGILFLGTEAGSERYQGDIFSAFLNGVTTVPGAIRTTNVVLNSSDTRLSHKVGAVWNSNCDALTDRYTFPDHSVASDDFERSSALYQIKNEVIRTNIDALLLAGTSTETTSTPINFVIEKDLIETERVPLPVVGGPLGNQFNPLGKTFGHVKVIGELTVFYRKISPTTIEVVQVRVTGAFDDLYDFNYHSKPRNPNSWFIGGFSRPASLVQAGFASLGIGGRVFFTRLEFNTGWQLHSQQYSK